MAAISQISQKSCDLIDAAFPPYRIDEVDKMRTNIPYPQTRSLLSFRAKEINGYDPVPEYIGYWDCTRTEIDGDGRISNLLQQSASYPIPVVLSCTRNAKVSALQLAESYAKCIGALAPNEICEDVADTIVICADIVGYNNAPEALKALEALCKSNTIAIVYADTDISGTCGIEASLPISQMKARYRGNIQWHGKPPTFLAKQQSALSSAVQRDIFLSSLDSMLEPLFDSHTDEHVLKQTLSQAKIEISNGLVDAISCGYISIDQDIFDFDGMLGDTVHSDKMPPLLSEVTSYMIFSEGFDNRRMMKDDYLFGKSEKLDSIVQCWKNVVLSDTDDKTLPCKPYGTNCMLNCDVARVAELAERYHMNSYVSAITQGISLKDLMIEQTAKINERRRKVANSSKQG